MVGLPFKLGSIVPGGRKESEDYKAGFSAAEKKYKKLEMERNVAVGQLRRLGYELGEEPCMIHAASSIKRHCRSCTSCEGCEFNSKEGCILNGETPSVWMVF